MGRSRSSVDKPGKITPKILDEQTRFSYDVFPITTSMQAVSVCVIGFLAWEEADAETAWFWFTAAAGVIFLRILLYLFYKRAGESADSTRWRRAFLAGALASATLVLIATVLFYGELSQTGKTVFTLVVMGVVSGALPVLATDLRSYTAFVMLNILPLAFFNLADPAIAVKLIGAVMLVFVGMAMMAAHLFNKALLDSMIYRYRSEMLADRLQVANDRLSAANRELQRISTVDDLTGVYNRRFFNQRYEEVWADHVRQRQTLSALMIDVDLFKNYNDHFGHLQGDQCLARIAAEITGVIKRPRDFVARFGGEEFVMLLPNTNVKGAREIAQRIHERIEQLAIPHKRPDGEARVTVSIGGATVKPDKDTSGDAFLQRVDQALYQAKRSGRNTSIFL